MSEDHMPILRAKRETNRVPDMKPAAFTPELSDEDKVIQKEILAKKITNELPIGYDKKEEPKMAPLTGEGHRYKDYNPAVSDRMLAEMRGDLSVAQDDKIDYQMDIPDDKDVGFDKQVGGRYNNSVMSRYTNYKKGIQDLLDERDVASKEVMGTKFDIGGPQNTGIGAGWNPRGQGVNSMSYGVQLPYIPQVVRDLRKKDGGEYSPGYLNSYALALFAAMGLTGDALEGLDPSAIQEYADMAGVTTADGLSGQDLFGRWFDAAMKAQGRDPKERFVQLREPVRRALLLSQLTDLSNRGSKTAAQFLEDLKAQTRARRMGWKNGSEEEQKAASDAIETLFNGEYTPEEGMEMRNISNVLDVENVLRAALTGKYGDDMELGRSLKREVASDLMSPEFGAAASPEELEKTRANYDYLQNLIQDEELAKRFLPDVIDERARRLRVKGTPLTASYAGKLAQIAEKVRAGESLTPEDSAVLERWGVEATPRAVLAQIIGSDESAGNYLGLLKLMEDEKEDITDYLLPKKDLAVKYGADNLDDVEDLSSSQRGLYIRNLVNSLAGDVRDSLAGNNTVVNKYRGKTPSVWENLRYAIHRAPRDSLYKKFTEQYSNEDIEKLKGLDRKAGQWSWKDEDVRGMLQRVKETGQISPEDVAVLKKMGFIREGNSVYDYPLAYLNKILDSNKIGGTLEEMPASKSPVMTLAKVADLQQMDLPAEDRALLDSAMADFLPGILEGGKENGSMLRAQFQKYDNARRALNRLADKYLGGTASEEVGLKNFDTDAVDDISPNAMDVFRYLDEDERSMTSPQTYASNLKYYDKAKEETEDISNADKDVSRLGYLRNKAMNEGNEESARNYGAKISKLEKEKEINENRLAKDKARMAYGDSKVTMDQEAAMPAGEEEVSEASDKMQEDMDSYIQNLDDNDQYVTGRDEVYKRIGELDPANVAKNLLLALARRKMEQRGEELNGNIQNWPLYDKAMADRYLDYVRGNADALEPSNLYSPDEIDSKVKENLLGGGGLEGEIHGGVDPEQLVNSMFEFYKPVSDEDLALARTQFDKVPGALDKGTEPTPEPEETRTLERLMPELHDMARNIYEKINDPHWETISGGLSAIPAEERGPDWAKEKVYRKWKDIIRPEVQMLYPEGMMDSAAPEYKPGKRVYGPRNAKSSPSEWIRTQPYTLKDSEMKRYIDAIRDFATEYMADLYDSDEMMNILAERGYPVRMLPEYEEGKKDEKGNPVPKIDEDTKQIIYSDKIDYATSRKVIRDVITAMIKDMVKRAAGLRDEYGSDEERRYYSQRYAPYFKSERCIPIFRVRRA